MDDPLLSTLCTICHIDPPKYTCPRCSTETCSLTCSKRHKLWSSCSGVRDPTIYKPRSELFTASGVDHDYNFLHSIEHGISRSEKRLIEDLGIVTREELKSARTGEPEAGKDEARGERAIENVLRAKAINVIKAPKGMRRNKENTTSWNKKHRAINWQVEWIREGTAGRALYRSLGEKKAGDVYDMLVEEERWMGMSSKEKGTERKRKAADTKDRANKKARLELPILMASCRLQNPKNGAWNSMPEHLSEDLEEENLPAPERDYHLYLHRVLTPSSFPRVLVPLDTEKSITDLLAHRDVLEFPSIHVLNFPPEELPKKFMLEKDYLVAIGKAPPEPGKTVDINGGEEDEDESSSGDSSDSSDESSSSEEESSDSDKEMEDGEAL